MADWTQSVLWEEGVLWGRWKVGATGTGFSQEGSRYAPGTRVESLEEREILTGWGA